ncbi:MAG: lytic murein transglycosylase [Solirubrobacterales bacterium]
MELSAETVQCEYAPPPPQDEGVKGTAGASGDPEGNRGIGAATAVPEGEEAERRDPEEPAGPTEPVEAAPERAESIEAPETDPGTANGGTTARSPESLKAGKDGSPEPGTAHRAAAAPISLSAPPGLGLGGASTLPLGQIELPPLLLPVYQACGTTYDVPWEVLAAINKIESGFGSNMGPSSAGAVGPMQFMPATWSEDGLDANGDGVANAWDPFDSICAAARYLAASGAPDDLHRAIFAYNHADWYVEEVLREARNFEALPENLLAAMTALAEGETTPAPEATGYREPVASSTLTALPDWAAVPSPLEGEAGGATAGNPPRGPVAEVSAPAGSAVTAVADATVVVRGHSSELGTYVILRDPYGTRYTYSGLGHLRRKVDGTGRDRVVVSPDGDGRRRLYANAPHPRQDDRVALRKGTKVRAGTVLGEVAASSTPGFDFALQPSGSAPVAPLEFLRAWKRGGADGIYLVNGRSAHAAENPATLLVAGDRRLREKALHGHLLKLPPCLRRRIARGALASRPLAAAEFLAAESGEPIGISAQACAGSDRFRLPLSSLGGAAPIQAGSPRASALVASVRRMQGAVAPQSVHGPVVGDASAASASAAEARISSSPDSAEEGGPAAVELDFLPPRSASLRGGDAVAPVDAPIAVQAMVAAANQINQTPYIWGGGHGAWVSGGYDCSGAVSYVLHAAGLLAMPETSGSLASFGAPGPGHWVTIYANAGHVYAEIAGLRWDTVGDASGSGPRWHLEPPYPEGFVVRHPVGL